MTIPRSFGTHSGTFHADEVTACALLLLFDFIDIQNVFRTRDLCILEKCQYVCDVGGIYDPRLLKFDHHQATYRGELSSAGMIWLHFKEQKIITDEVYTHFNKLLIHGIDAHDNGRSEADHGICTFSNVISNFVPIEYDALEKDQDDAFLQAVKFTLGHLDRMLKRFSYVQSCKQKVLDAMALKQKYLYFDQALPWIDTFFENGGENHPALFVIMPSGSHWKLRGIPPTSFDRMKVRVPLPETWAGLLDEELKKVSGIQGGIFCHKGRFISVWEDRDSAFKALKEILDKEHL
ncbi:MAG: MYG1 family protein [Chlamydiae bacterium]|nr:MYG1 family protein [Chlamydiota bacterium]